MHTNAILLGYQERILSLHAAASQLRIGQIVALAIMSAAFIAIVVLSYFSIARRSFSLPCSLIPLPLAIWAGKTGKLRNTALLQTLRLETWYRRGVDRLEGNWAGSGVSGEEFVPPAHPYAKDLQVFGQGSLFELLCTCRTDVGRRHLACYLLETPALQESTRRQQAVRELQGNRLLRERLHLLGRFASEQTTWNALTDWLESDRVRTRMPFSFVALSSSIALAILLLLACCFVVTWSQIIFYIAALSILNGALALVYRTRLLTVQPAIFGLSSELSILREGLSLLGSQPFASPLLTELSALAAQNDPAIQLRKLERLIAAWRERDKEWFYAVSRSLLIGTQLFLAIEKWRALHRSSMRCWLSAWGEFEALMALATYAYEHPANTFPRFSENPALLECQGIGHPLLPAAACVRNDIAWNDRIRLFIISGSNMAGKSTLLRAIGLNAVLAFAGAPVCALRMSLSRFSICASIAVQDSLRHGKSKFVAELDRLKQALTIAPEQSPVLFLIDEILSGTNSKDRRAAAEAILGALIRQSAIGAFSTHDLALTELAALPDLGGVNVHMASKDDADPLNFDYLLKAGIATQSNALAIARLAGVSV